MKRTLAAALLAACTSARDAADAGGDAGDDAAPPLGGSRPLATFRAPDAWDGKTPLPLLLVLHGYGAGGLAQAIYFGATQLVEEKQIFLAAPDGAFDSSGKRFWNAVDTCCDFDHSGVDDVGYLAGLVAEIAARYPVDKRRVWVMGHSNGGAMTLRLACDRTGTFAAALELAGPFWSDPDVACAPGAAIPLRVVHGTADTTVPFAGTFGADGGAGSPGGEAIAAFFAKKNGCAPTEDTSAPRLDLDSALAGAETKVTRWTGCPAGGDVELWAIEGGTHIPALGPAFREAAWSFFSAHAR